MILPNKYQVRASIEAMPEALIATLPDEAERENVRKTSAYDTTATLTVIDTDKDELMAYAVYGHDDNNHLTIYAARCFLAGMGAIALKSLFGVSKVVGTPLRVHAEKVKTFARMMGAEEALDAIDGDGVPMGVFHG